VLTGGGDVPGLNPCIRTLVYAAADRGYEVVGLRRGWAGLLDYNLDDDKPQDHCVQPLTKRDVRTIDRTGGTFLHTSRTNPGKVAPKDVPPFLSGQGQFESEGPFDFTSHALAVVERLGLDWLVAIGGDDTLSYAEAAVPGGVKTLAVPKTMDNDVFGTDYCIGFSTAVTRSVQFIHQLRTSTGSHERIAVVELFGRNCGETSLLSAYLAGVDRAIICEVPFDVELLAHYLLEDKAANPSNYAMVTFSEGARMLEGEILERGEADAYGHRKLGGIGLVTGELLKKLTGEDIVYQQVGYLMRSGAPDALDLMVAVNFANMAINLIDQDTPGSMVALRRGTYTSVPIDHDVRHQARRRRGPLRREALPSTHPPGRRQTHVPLLAGLGLGVGAWYQVQALAGRRALVEAAGQQHHRGPEGPHLVDDLGHALPDHIATAVDQRHHRLGGRLDPFDQVAVHRHGGAVQAGHDDHGSYGRQPRGRAEGYSSQSSGDMRREPLRSLASARSMDSQSSWIWRCTAWSSFGSHQSSSIVRTRSCR
jgi:6-phosphofructokinase 1